MHSMWYRSLHRRAIVEGASRHLIPHELNNTMNVSSRFISAIEGLKPSVFILPSLLDLANALEIVEFT